MTSEPKSGTGTTDEERSAHNTEEKIKQAARTLFQQKGFAGTRTRAIAEKAGINPALLNYYFRSKKKLFNLIMGETFEKFAGAMAQVINRVDTSLEKKIETIADRYINLLTKEPQLVFFVINELKDHPRQLLDKLELRKKIMGSTLQKQYLQAAGSGAQSGKRFLHFMANLMSLTLFPFAAAHMLKRVGGLTDDAFIQLMEERKKLIPLWVIQWIKNGDTTPSGPDDSQQARP